MIRKKLGCQRFFFRSISKEHFEFPVLETLSFFEIFPVLETLRFYENFPVLGTLRFSIFSLCVCVCVGPVLGDFEIFNISLCVRCIGALSFYEYFPCVWALYWRTLSFDEFPLCVGPVLGDFAFL